MFSLQAAHCVVTYVSGSNCIVDIFLLVISNFVFNSAMTIINEKSDHWKTQLQYNMPL